jgi:DNA gyrase subunit A
MGRNTSGVKGISLKKGDSLVGMVVADPAATLLTICQNGYGKRTPFGLGDELAAREEAIPTDDENLDENAPVEEEVVEEPEDSDDVSSSMRYRTQRRGGKGVIDIKTTKRNGPVVGIVPVVDGDELIMMTSRGKIQRIAAADISVIGRNTQGVRIMSLDENDTLAAIVRVLGEDIEEAAAAEAAAEAARIAAASAAQPSMTNEADAETPANDEAQEDDSADGEE